MLRAVLQGQSVCAWDCSETDRGKAFLCPLCESRLGLVLPDPEIRIEHFRHLDTSPCVSETYQHLEMKYWVARVLAAANRRVAQPETFVANRIADVTLGKDMAVECQVSSLSEAACARRTQDLNQAGYWVLWLVPLERYLEPIIRSTELERFLHRVYLGRIYALGMHAQEVENFVINAVHLQYKRRKHGTPQPSTLRFVRRRLVQPLRLVGLTTRDVFDPAMPTGLPPEYKLLRFMDPRFWRPWIGRR